MKFSGSPRRFGENRLRDARAVNRMINPSRSL